MNPIERTKVARRLCTGSLQPHGLSPNGSGVLVLGCDGHFRTERTIHDVVECHVGVCIYMREPRFTRPARPRRVLLWKSLSVEPIHPHVVSGFSQARIGRMPLYHEMIFQSTRDAFGMAVESVRSLLPPRPLVRHRSASKEL